MKITLIILGENLVDDEYWSPNGGQLDQDDPDWASDCKSNTKKKVKGTRLKKRRGKTSTGGKAKEFNCTQCDPHESFDTRNDLKEHLKETHGGVGLEKLMYKCSEADCKFEAMTQKLLNDHKTDIHGIATTFKCRVNKQEITFIQNLIFFCIR